MPTRLIHFVWGGDGVMFHHLPVDRHLDLFHLLAALNNAAKNIHVQVSFETPLSMISFEFQLLKNSELCPLLKEPHKNVKLVSHSQAIYTKDTLDLYSILNFSII